MTKAYGGNRSGYTDYPALAETAAAAAAPRCWTRLSVPRPRVVTMTKLSKDDRELFLAEPRVAALSVSAGPDRGPLTVPLWFQYEPGGEPWILSGVNARKTHLIEAAGRFTLMTDRTEPTDRYVSVEGPVSRMIPQTEAMVREMAERYLPPDKATAYVKFHLTELGEHLAIYLRPEHWLSSDLG
jgi:hypothetical protein